MNVVWWGTSPQAYRKTYKVARAVIDLARTPTRIFSGKDIAFGGSADVSVSLWRDE